MDVILRDDIAGLGKRGDILKVADGYARNNLLPRGRAIIASQGALSQATAMRKSRDLKDAKDKESAEAIASRLVGASITVSAKAGAEGKLFGSVGDHDIVEAVQAQKGIEIDHRKVVIHEPIRSLGTHPIQLKLHSEVTFEITLEVVKA